MELLFIIIIIFSIMVIFSISSNFIQVHLLKYYWNTKYAYYTHQMRQLPTKLSRRFLLFICRFLISLMNSKDIQFTLDQQ